MSAKATTPEVIFRLDFHDCLTILQLKIRTLLKVSNFLKIIFTLDSMVAQKAQTLHIMKLHANLKKVHAN